MKLRFSLRLLLIVTTLVAIVCWWRVRPARVADQFVQAVTAGDYQRADKYFKDPKYAFVADFMADYRNKARAIVVRQSAAQWLAGQCEIGLELIDHRGLGANMHFVIPVTYSGLHKPQVSVSDAGYWGFFDSSAVRQ
jgi:hypothetical protein